MSFYKSKALKVNGIPVIIYLEKGIEEILGNDISSYTNYLKNIYSSNTDILLKGQYHILIFWNNEGNVMLDIWIYSQLHKWTDTPTVDVANFRNKQRYFDEGVTAGDGLILLGEEEKKRRQTSSLEEYLNRRELSIDQIVLGQAIFT